LPGVLKRKIEFLKGVGPERAKLLQEELGIFFFEDLINHFPFRYDDRSKIYRISEIPLDNTNVQVKGRVTSQEIVGQKRGKRLVVNFADETGQIELVWFRGISWMQKRISLGVHYLIYGKPTLYGNRINIAHPEMEVFSANPNGETSKALVPIYSSTEKLKKRYLDSKGLGKLIESCLQLSEPDIRENLPDRVIRNQKLIGRKSAYMAIHKPENAGVLAKARFRMKFEELFIIQVKLLQNKQQRKEQQPGFVFSKTGLITHFYNDVIPFELTGAQKRVVKEIYADLKSGTQMNRLLQGDVGSGKTIVAFLTMLLAIDSGKQAAMMAPTEILAIQHYVSIRSLADKMDLVVAKLTGSTKSAERREILKNLNSGSINILIGTHALLEDRVQFQDFGLAVIDEQHRFGVAQRARLWEKSRSNRPHILVTTATPIPRTLAMTLYGDLDVSIIDELPKGRKPIKTAHYSDTNRLKVLGFLKKQIEEGRQVYVVYPLIEESEKLDLKDLMDGFESIQRAFPDVPLSILHGRMAPKDKEFEMERFKKGETKILVSTTVIEVGVDVPNASVMVIENAEKFGLAQLHQLRGRVGRGSEQSFCILMTGRKVSKDARVRIETMVGTNDGFQIADVDLQLRGPGEISGTRQSGVLELKIANLAEDAQILQIARAEAKSLTNYDPKLEDKQNEPLIKYIFSNSNELLPWERIS